MVKCLPEFEYFYCVLEKLKHYIFKIRRSKVTDYAALISIVYVPERRLSKVWLNLQVLAFQKSWRSFSPIVVCILAHCMLPF